MASNDWPLVLRTVNVPPPIRAWSPWWNMPYTFSLYGQRTVSFGEDTQSVDDDDVGTCQFIINPSCMSKRLLSKNPFFLLAQSSKNGKQCARKIIRIALWLALLWVTPVVVFLGNGSINHELLFAPALSSHGRVCKLTLGYVRPVSNSGGLF